MAWERVPATPVGSSPSIPGHSWDGGHGEGATGRSLALAALLSAHRFFRECPCFAAVRLAGFRFAALRVAAREGLFWYFGW